MDAKGGTSAPVGIPSTCTQPAQAPQPISAEGQPVIYLTAEQKARLDAKYGKIEAPKSAELMQVAQGCKTQ
eukprot:CAMPEP_0183354726 /NCGR_PEP_ID=MMETSP0164_2-20130417/37953_1 /TAXON_ID=221442 /ORGANISM="Coccolithus pelagicus ssp braarudi, Strain PLY182g" /LENGTH=70 /DNA_ID=CAMNT_0025527667 /DNA_START=23 /DNA_END=235 /DNA_ORIENTATION=+